MNCTAGNGSKARGSSTGGGGGPQSSLVTVFDSRRAFVSLCAMILSATFASRRNQLWYTTHELLQNISSTPFFKAELHVSGNQLFGAYWVPGNVLHLMYMNSSEPPYKVRIIVFRASQVAWWVKNPPAIKETETQPLGWEDPLKEGRAILENPRDRGVGRATAHGVAKSQTRLSDWATEHAHIHTARLSSPSYGWGIWTTKARWLTPGRAAGEGSQDLNPGWASWASTTEPLCFLQKQWWLVRVRPIPGHGSKKLRNTD